VYTGAAYSTVADDRGRLAAIIENVSNNELLYENREVIGEISYRHLGPVTWEEALTASNRQFRHVGQDGLIYLEIHATQEKAAGRPVTGALVHAYDGKRSISYQEGGTAAIDRGVRHEHPQIVRPHTILLYFAEVRYPLSTFLKGREAILAHPNGAGFVSNPFAVRYLGEEQVGGLSCHKIAADFFSSRGGQKPERTVRRFLWLAPARNYLPVKEMCYELRLSAEIPTGEGVLEDLREIAPGVWFPFSAVYTAYDKNILVNQKRRAPTWKQTWTIKSASLDPKYEIGLFRDIAMPDGTSVAESEGGKYVRTYISGSREDPDAGTTVRAPSVSALIRWGVVLASVLAFGAFAVVWCLRKKAHAPR
jgi:hypothetical protein